MNSIVEKIYQSWKNLEYIFDHNRYIFRMIIGQSQLVYKSLYEVFNIRKNENVIKRPHNICGVIDNVKGLKCTEDLNCLKYTDVTINFALEKSFILITDIIGNTKLYNENPCRMKNQVDRHDSIVRYLTKEFNGHIVANEGDSFHIAFETIYNAINFGINLRPQLKDQYIDFAVKIAINHGVMSVRNFYGYKCYGEPIDEALMYIKHNDGKKICIKNNILKNGLASLNFFCLHE